jgi:hypothetical protein
MISRAAWAHLWLTCGGVCTTHHLQPTTAPSHGATTGALAFVTPRILNRPIRAPTHTNLETAELQYQREQHRLDVKRQLAQEGHARRCALHPPTL